MNLEFSSKVKMETITRKLESLYITDFENESTSEEVTLKKMAADTQNLIS